MITIICTPKRQLPPPQPLPKMTEDMARKLTSDWWNGMAIGIIIGAGAMVSVLHFLGRI